MLIPLDLLGCRRPLAGPPAGAGPARGGRGAGVLGGRGAPSIRLLRCLLPLEAAVLAGGAGDPRLLLQDLADGELEEGGGAPGGAVGGTGGRRREALRGAAEGGAALALQGGLFAQAAVIVRGGLVAGPPRRRAERGEEAPRQVVLPGGRGAARRLRGERGKVLQVRGEGQHAGAQGDGGGGGRGRGRRSLGSCGDAGEGQHRARAVDPQQEVCGDSTGSAPRLQTHPVPAPRPQGAPQCPGCAGGGSEQQWGQLCPKKTPEAPGCSPPKHPARPAATCAVSGGQHLVLPVALLSHQLPQRLGHQPLVTGQGKRGRDGITRPPARPTGTPQPRTAPCCRGQAAGCPRGWC